MQKVFLTLFLNLFTLFLFSQSTIQGYLLTDKKESVEGIVVSLHADANTKKFLAYSISNAEGFYQLNYDDDIEGKALRLRSLMYRDTCIILSGVKHEYNISLKESIKMLKEVKVKSTPIIGKGDTVTYITAAFAQKRDFSIAEVINRMPGFELMDNGKVLYHGREIEKYYIEGSDLLEERYALANKNLPHKAVASVDVMHNHQSKKIFENRIASDQTSLNIKLKKSVAFTGRGELGAAYKPWGRYVNLTPMMFTKKYQFIGSYQSNNIGSDLSDQMSGLRYKNGKLEGEEKMHFSFLGLPSLHYPNIKKSRYLDNDANLVTINGLRKLNDKTELKINSAYLSDNIDELKNSETSYYLDEGLYKTNELYENRFKNRSFFTDLNLRKNLSSVYLNNKIGYIQFWDKSKAIIQEGTTQQINARTPHRSLYNILDCTLPFFKGFASFYSSVDLNESDEDLTFTPNVFNNILEYGEDISVNKQNLKNRSFVSKNHFKFTKKWHAFILESLVGFNYESQELESSMYSSEEILDFDVLSNDITWNKTDYVFNPCLKYETSDLKLSFDLPLNYYFFKYNDHKYSSQIRQDKVLFNPRFYLKYEWNSAFDARLTLSEVKSMGNPNSMLQGNIVYDHRSMRSRVAQIDESKSRSFRLNIGYRDAINGLFMRFGYNKRIKEKDFILDKSILSPGVFQYSLIEKENDVDINQLTGDFSLYLSNLHLNLALKSDFTNQKSDYLLNGDLKEFKLNSYKNHFKLNFDKWNFLALDYGYSILWGRQESNGNKTKSTEQVHTARICYYFNSKQWLELRPEYTIFSQSENKTQESLFTDLIYSFTPKGSRFSYLLECKNIFNSKNVYSSFNSDLSSVYSEFNLRPRAFVARVRFSFGKN
ncbi:hypothetical protein [Marinifilum sp. D714]|uniref:hypothetical protein n=1 Tax=Marinifilum sp. D714 TaxID=2937523 RepID=UPI0027BFE92F|nr:hypothetical protein [Marinifilum sp. D714]MDQ2179543.1 hypothetical protein [Marinifilum sp. D714]